MPLRPAPRARSRRAGRIAWVTAGVVAVTIAGMLWGSRRTVVPPTPPPPRPREEYATALRLGRERQHLASLPHLRSALAGVREDFMEIHLEYAEQLYSATFEARPRPWPMPAVRSSIERVAMMREALAQMDRATHFPLGLAQRAGLFRRHGEMMQAWGLDWEALRSFREAERANPASTDEARRSQAFMNLMREPSRYALNAVPVEP